MGMSTPRVHAVVLILCLSIFSAGCTGSPSGELVVKVIEDVPPGAEVNKVGPSEIIEKEEFDKVVNGTHANFTTREDSSVIVRGGIVKVDSVEEMKDFVDSALLNPQTA